MALHEVQLKGYSVRPGNLSLGTFDSYGIEQLHVTLDDTWSGLAVTATFNPPESEPVEIRVPENGLIDVPAEATANEGTGTIVYCGVANGVQLITKTQGYNVITHGNVGGTEPFNPSESLATQVLQAALNAEKNSAEAKDVADGLRNDADSGKFNGKDGAKGDKGETGTTPQLKIGEDNLWHVSYDNGATWVSLGVKATGAAGKDGEDGLTPHIGENGNWWVENTDTCVSAKGDKGDTGAKGADGVSPTATVTQTDDGAEFTVTDASGTTTATIRNGTDGKDGAPGAPGKDAVVDATLTQDGQAADAKVTGEKIGQLKEDTTALQKRQNILVGSETGNPIAVDDAFAAPLCGLNVYGKSTQDGTPSPDNPVPIVSAGDSGSVAVKMTGANTVEGTKSGNTGSVSGVSYTANKDGISFVGNADTALNIYLHNDIKAKLTPGVYYLTTKGLSTSVSINFYQVGSFNNDVQNREVRVLAGKEYTILLSIAKGANVNGLVVQVSLTRNKITTYSPYREQLLTLPTPNGLPGIPVTSGGNYTDTQGQQWICDEVDLERGVKVQRVDKTAFDTTKTLAEQNAAILATPVETPLTPAEIAAYKALTAYAPDTVVQASDGAGIKLDYQRDVNLVVKNLEDAMASMTTTY